MILEEGLSGSVTFTDYRGPHFPAGSGEQPILGAIAVTRKRFVVWTGDSKHMDLPHDDPLRSRTRVSLEGPNRVRFDYDASTYVPNRSGQVSVLLATPHAARIVEFLTAAG